MKCGPWNMKLGQTLIRSPTAALMEHLSCVPPLVETIAQEGAEAMSDRSWSTMRASANGMFSDRASTYCLVTASRLATGSADRISGPVIVPPVSKRVRFNAAFAVANPPWNLLDMNSLACVVFDRLVAVLVMTRYQRRTPVLMFGFCTNVSVGIAATAASIVE